jgi:hypothetical protein
LSDRELDVRFTLLGEAGHWVGQGSHRVAFAGDLQGHALEEIAFFAAVDEEAFLGLAEHVDEARRHRQAMRGDGSLGAQIARRTDIRDSVPRDTHITHIGGAATTVVDFAPLDDDVVFGGSREGRATERP